MQPGMYRIIIVVLPEPDTAPTSVSTNHGAPSTDAPHPPRLLANQSFTNPNDTENRMETLRISETKQPTGRRLGRPPLRIKKVTRSIRIPADVDGFLADYSQQHGLLIGDVVAEAVVYFRAKSAPASFSSRRSRAATA